MEKTKAYYDAFLGILCGGELASLSSISITCPLGLLVLATTVRNSFSVPARVYNLKVSQERALSDMTKFIRDSHRPLACLTLLAGNVNESLDLAKKLKTIGCDVLVGGPEVRPETAEHYASLDQVDGAVIGPAENLIEKIFARTPEGYFGPNVFVKGRKGFSSRIEFSFDTIAVDYDLLFELERHDGVSFFWGADCHLRNKRCYFCSRQLQGLGHREPSTVWNELRAPLSKGLKTHYCTADSVATNIEALERLVEEKPSDFADTKIKAFINASQVNEKTGKLLKRLNAIAAVGIESFSLLGNVQKGGTTVTQNLEAIELLDRHKIKMILTFVLGLPGETMSSLQSDAEQVLEITKKYQGNIHTLTFSPLLIALGSRAYSDLLKDCDGRLPCSGYATYDPLRASEIYLDRFCKVKRNQVIEHIGKLSRAISDINPSIILDSKGISRQELEVIKSY